MDNIDNLQDKHIIYIKNTQHKVETIQLIQYILLPSHID